MKSNLLTTARLYMKAHEEFNNDPEMLKSCGNIPLNSEETSWKFFTLRDELAKLGLEYAEKLTSPSAASALTKAVYRWAVWQQAASHTAALTLMAIADSAVIMENLGEAEEHMFRVVRDIVHQTNWEGRARPGML